jgi:hypothetical protein
MEAGTADPGEFLMGRIARWMIRLYPASWRARYRDELEALLSDTGADVRIVCDLARGGMGMQLKAWPFPLLALVLGVVGLIAGAGISFLAPSVYVSEAVVRIDSGHLITNRADIRAAEEVIESRGNLSRLITGLGLYRKDLLVEPLEDVIVEMRRHIQLDPIAMPGSGTAFRIRFDYGDRIRAQQTVAALVESFRRTVPELSRRYARDGERMIVLDVATLPAAPVFPAKPLLWGGGFLAGMMVAAILRAVFRDGWVRRWFGFVAVAMVTGGVMIAAYGAVLGLWTNRYRSTEQFVLRTSQRARVAPMIAEILSLDSLSAIANDPRLRLYQREMDERPLEQVLRGMREHVSIAQHPSGEGDGTDITLSFDYYDRFKAEQTATIFLAKFEELARLRLPRPAETAASVPVIEVLKRASAPQSPASPDRMLMASLGGICGVFLAGIISLIRRRWNPEHQIPVDSISA